MAYQTSVKYCGYYVAYAPVMLTNVTYCSDKCYVKPVQDESRVGTS